ncbi:MAG TPA: DUF4388 domain-containing protein [Myxococcales bacterium]
MALHGDFKTFPLPDLLQWLEGRRAPGRLTVICGGGERVFLLGPWGIARYGEPGLLERLARIFQLLKVMDPNGVRIAVAAARSGKRCEEAFAAAGVTSELLQEVGRDVATQAATDLFEDANSSFHLADEVDDEGEESVQVDLPLRELLYEAARRYDEAGPASKQVGSDGTLMFPTGKATPKPRGLARAALAAIGGGAAVGAVRLALGLSAFGATLILFQLWRDGLVRIEGVAAPKHDPLSIMLSQGEGLLRQGEFDAAALVFNSLLASDPSDKRVREFARAVEREHMDALYRKLTPMAVPTLLAPESSLATLRQDERIVASLINGRWDVSTLVLASPLRELPTLRAIDRMSELGYVGLGHR